MIEEKVPGIHVSKKPYIKTSFEVWVGGELLFSKLKMKTFPDFSAIVDSVYNIVVKGDPVQVWIQNILKAGGGGCCLKYAYFENHFLIIFI